MTPKVTHVASLGSEPSTSLRAVMSKAIERPSPPTGTTPRTVRMALQTGEQRSRRGADPDPDGDVDAFVDRVQANDASQVHRGHADDQAVQAGQAEQANTRIVSAGPRQIGTSRTACIAPSSRRTSLGNHTGKAVISATPLSNTTI